jgi:fatty-acyl-CoA synthase
LSYVLAQPARPDDADNPLTRVFGNEAAPADVSRFAERFACQVRDGFGSTEGGLSITKTDDTPPGALGRGTSDVRVLDPETGEEKAVAVFDERGRLVNAEESVGELVNMDGPMAFEGYWGAPEDTAQRTRDGRYWSGDLGYRDEAGFLYFAGRSLDRLRVGGENFPAAPVARMMGRHPQVVEVAVYAVPDPTAGDQLMVAVHPADGFDPTAFLRWVGAQPEASTTWLPSYLRVGELPRTATGKVLVRTLAQQRWYGEGVWVRDGDAMRPFTAKDGADLEAAFVRAGRPLP